MKIARAVIKTIFFLMLTISATTFVLVYILAQNMSQNYKINRGQKLKIDTIVPVTAVFDGTKQSQNVGRNIGETFQVDLKMFGVIPFSTVEVEVVDEMYVAVLGNPFGMKTYTEGVLVVELTDVDSKDGYFNPAKKAGIKVGDYIKSVDGISVSCNEDLSEIVALSDGKTLSFETERDGTIIHRKVQPVKSIETDTYRVGIWVRDSSAGIGTLSFYSPSTGIVCGLGHGICDSDTGEILELNSGELVGAQIVSVKKGGSGSPGELKGKFTYDDIADIALNSECGVYGFLKSTIDVSSLTELALKQEVKDGEAQILCTIDGNTPRLYSCTIKKRSSAYLSKTQNLIVTITDEELISKTGGIVQGMSGAPILQKGKLVGALTHVLVDDSKTGYGIFAENMLETAQSVAESNKLKDVS